MSDEAGFIQEVVTDSPRAQVSWWGVLDLGRQKEVLKTVKYAVSPGQKVLAAAGDL